MPSHKHWKNSLSAAIPSPITARNDVPLVSAFAAYMRFARLDYTYISSITPSAGAESFEHTGPAGGGGGVAGAAGRGAAAAAAVRYGF